MKDLSLTAMQEREWNKMKSLVFFSLCLLFFYMESCFEKNKLFNYYFKYNSSLINKYIFFFNFQVTKLDCKVKK